MSQNKAPLTGLSLFDIHTKFSLVMLLFYCVMITSCLDMVKETVRCEFDVPEKGKVKVVYVGGGATAKDIIEVVWLFNGLEKTIKLIEGYNDINCIKVDDNFIKLALILDNGINRPVDSFFVDLNLDLVDGSEVHVIKRQ